MEGLIASAPAVEWPPPCPLPDGSPLVERYSGPDGSQPINRWYCFAQRYEGTMTVDWSAAVVDDFCAGMQAGTQSGTYGYGDDARVDNVFAHLLAPVSGSVGMVLGSERPWVECLALRHGAAEVWTFEYATIVSTHPRLKAKTTHDMAADHLSGALPLMDWVASYSSLEHSGLGRYGDALNPDADKEAMLMAWCFLKPGGLMLLGAPMACANSGYIFFNAHRVYGDQRLAYVTAGFELVGYVDGCVHLEDGSTDMVLLRKVGLDAPPLTASDFEAARAKPLLSRPAVRARALRPLAHGRRQLLLTEESSPV